MSKVAQDIEDTAARIVAQVLDHSEPGICTVAPSALRDLIAQAIQAEREHVKSADRLLQVSQRRVRELEARLAPFLRAAHARASARAGEGRGPRRAEAANRAGVRAMTNDGLWAEGERAIGVVTADIERAFVDARTELLNAQRDWPPMNTAHEGYAVLLEELDELKEHVWTHPRNRDMQAMRHEAIQVAAMALRLVVDICDGDRGRL